MDDRPLEAEAEEEVKAGCRRRLSGGSSWTAQKKPPICSTASHVLRITLRRVLNKFTKFLENYM